MRHKYSLTDETRKVLNGNVGPIAKEMNVTDKHLYGIIYNTSPDPFPRFETLREAAIKANVDVSPWDDKLKSAKEKDLEKADIIEQWLTCVEDLFTLQKEMGQIISDGIVSPEECRTVLPKISRAEDALNRLYRSVNARKGE
jgi:hypothetical protein